MVIRHAEWNAQIEPSRWEKFVESLRGIPTWKWVAVALLSVLYLVAKYSSTIGSGKSVVDFLGGLPFAALFFYFLITAGSLFRPSRALDELSKSHSASGFLVKVTFFRNEHRVGQDDGVVTFRDGMLIYEGLQTSFQLNPTDVTAPKNCFANGPLIKAKDTRFGNYVGKAAWGFLLASDPSIRLYFFPLKVDNSQSIYEPFFDWLNSEQAGQQETILPPNF